MAFIYIYHTDINIEWLMFFSNKRYFHLKTIAYFDDVADFSPSKKAWKIVTSSKHPVQSAL